MFVLLVATKELKNHSRSCENKGNGGISLSEIHTFESGTAIVEVSAKKVTIKHKKGTYHSRKEKDIQTKSITGIQMKEPGMILAGHMQIIFSGSGESKGRSTLDAAKDENTVMFRKKDYKEFLRCKELIEQYRDEAIPKESSLQLSIADELKKFADLRDSGVITEEEFSAKKKQLLG
jgi:hypothetical protein